MKISIVVVVYDLAREAPRTLHSLSAAYQRRVSPDDYEVVVVENGSPEPLGREAVEKYGANFRYSYIDDADVSPVSAINSAVAETTGDAVALMIDGARILTPGVLHLAQKALAAFDDPVVAVPGWYLGPDLQRRAMIRGYDQDTEDELLKRIGWPRDGYRMFEIGRPDEAWPLGYLGPVGESNAVFMPRAAWRELGGCNEGFVSPGAGAANLDLFRRAAERESADVVILGAEGAFHQFHGGVSTNLTPGEVSVYGKQWRREYLEVTGREFDNPKFEAYFFGKRVRPALDYLAWSALMSPPGSGDPPSRRFALPMRVRAYVDVLHDRELARGWTLTEAAQEFTQLRDVVNKTRSEVRALADRVRANPRPAEAVAEPAPRGDAPPLNGRRRSASATLQSALDTLADAADTGSAMRAGGELIIAGFHRSGTSFAAQLLARAGLFVGADLLPENVYNPHGHIEDLDFLEIHQRLLAANDQNWQVAEPFIPFVPPQVWDEMDRLIEHRRSHHSQWGFKDPRVCFFLPAWKYLLPDAKVLLVYRHFADATYSLERRSARELGIRAPGRHVHRRFFENPDFALRMWLTHNRALLAFAAVNPRDVFCVSFDALQKGFPLSGELGARFGLDLDDVPTSSFFDGDATNARPGPQPLSNTRLAQELVDTLSELEDLEQRCQSVDIDLTASRV